MAKIIIKGLGHPDAKTIFDKDENGNFEGERYLDLSKIKNRKVAVQQGEKKIFVVIPDLSEEEIKDFIINCLQNNFVH